MPGQQSAILSASGGTSYNWSNGINSSSITVSPNTVTTYSVTATNNGCTASDNVTVFINPLPTITISPAQNICKGGTATLSASGGNTYNWSNGSTSSSITVYPASSTTYYVTVTNSYGCTATGSSVVYVNALPIANAGTDQTICSGANITLNASGGISYAWNIGDLTSSISVAPITTTSYTVTVTDINGCSASDDVTVLVNPIPIVNAGQDQTICQGQTAILGASGGSGYYWSNGSASSTIIVSPNTTTTYSVTVVNNGCTASDNVTVNVNASPVITVSPNQNICEGVSTTITTNGANSYIWNNGALTNVIIVTPTTTTLYVVTATSTNGCTTTGGATIYVHPLPPANAGPDQTICIGQNTTLYAMGGETYEWNTGDTTNVVHIAPSVTLAYTVTVTDNQCSASDEVIVNVVPLPMISFYPDITMGCPPLTVNFTNNSMPSDLNYIWDFGDGSSSSSQFPEHIYNYSGTYNVSLTAYNTYGCSSSQTFSGNITVYPGVSAEYIYSPTEITTMAPNVLFFEQCDNANFWNWNFGDTASGTFNYSAGQTPEHVFSGPGTYTIWLVSSNSYGCIDSVAHTLIVKELTTIFIPNAFTPNGNGTNDVFFPIGTNISPDDFTMYIYDRWGEQIYKTNYLSQGWDGKPEGSNRVCPMGVYVWLIYYKDIDGNEHKITGRVTLL